MSVMLDLIGSSIVGGILILSILRISAVGIENRSYFVEDLSVQENLRNVIEIVEDDFRKIGYGATISQNGNFFMQNILLEGDTSKIKYCSDIHHDTINVPRTLDTITYWLGGSVLSTPNKDDRYLMRKENNQPAQAWSVGLVQFKLTFLNSAGDSIPVPLSFNDRAKVRLIRIAVKVQSQFLTKSMFEADSMGYKKRSAIWRESRLIARNLTQ
ncbi:MAG: hypothetical protein ABSB78_09305 [Bacteroidota bacterium]